MNGERPPVTPDAVHPEVAPDISAATTTAVAVAAVMACSRVTFVVLSPDGTLLVRTVLNRVRLDEWDTPYQETLWAAVRCEVDPDHGAVNGMPLPDGLRVKVADLAGQDPRYPPNPVASAVLTTLGCQPRYWFGTVALVGAEDDEGITASLTPDQLEIIRKAHQLATSPCTRHPDVDRAEPGVKARTQGSDR